MYNVLRMQLVILLITLMVPIRRSCKIALIALLGVLSYKTVLITRRLLELLIRVLCDRARSEYKKIVNRIFKENFRFRDNFSLIPTKPTIFIATYPTSPIEYLAPALFPVPVCFMASQRAKMVMTRVYTDAECCYLPDGKNRYQLTKKLINEKLKVMSVFMYVEDQSRRYGRSVGKLRKGAFWIAKELGVTVTPVVIDNVVGRWGIVPEQKYEIHIGRDLYVHDPLSTLVKVRTMMREKKAMFALTKFNVLH